MAALKKRRTKWYARVLWYDCTGKKKENGKLLKIPPHKKKSHTSLKQEVRKAKEA